WHSGLPLLYEQGPGHGSPFGGPRCFCRGGSSGNRPPPGHASPLDPDRGRLLGEAARSASGPGQRLRTGDDPRHPHQRARTIYRGVSMNQLRVGFMAGGGDRREIESLEALPIDSLWTGGHIASRNAGPDAMSSLIRLATLTERVRVGTSIL